jgi:hypothetical protein
MKHIRFQPASAMNYYTTQGTKKQELLARKQSLLTTKLYAVHYRSYWKVTRGSGPIR